MEVSIKQIPKSSRYVLENLFRYYVYDMSEFMSWKISGDGEYPFNADALAIYWQQDDHIPYFIYVSGALAGFALVKRLQHGKTLYDMEQFFVLRRFKGQGVGKQALAKVVAIHNGSWQIRVLKENTAAFHFWQSAITQVVGKRYKITEEKDGDLLMYFIQFRHL